MKLIGSHTSPFVRKARVVLAEKRIEYEFVVDNPFGPASRVAEFNPLGKVPVLVTDDGATIYDSSVIVEYLDTVSPVGRLIPEPGRQRIQVKRWEALADGVMEAAGQMVIEGRRPARQQRRDAIERQSAKVEHALRAAAHDLAERNWCAGEGYSLADIALACALGYLDFRLADLDWRTRHPNLDRHAQKLFKRPSFEGNAHQENPPA